MRAADPHLIEWAVGLARTGGRLAAEAFNNGPREVEHKSDGSLVTATDRAVESLMRERITSEFPSDAILGEEYGERPGSSQRRWLLDPIDHTEAFVHGVGEFSTMVAVEDDDGIMVAAIDVPVLHETVWAGRGRGAFRNGSPIGMTEKRSLRGAYVATSDLDDWPVDVVVAALAAGVRVRTWGGGYGVGLAVSGRVDAFVDYDLDVWDVAPAVILASEAGGRCSAFDGTTRLDGGACLVAPPVLHTALLEVFGEKGS